MRPELRAAAGMNSFERTHHRYSLAITAVFAVAVVVLLIVLGAADDASGRGGPATGNGSGSVELTPVGSGDFSNPVNIGFAPGQPDNIYVVEQTGTVRVIESGTQQFEPFLDISELTNGSGEQGLLSIAFHPAYAVNGLVYAYYTDADNGDIVVSEFEAADPDDADEDSRREVIRVRHRANSNHNGGQLLFGPDDLLYLGTGDGGGGGDPGENAQSKRSLLGKLLRIDPVDPPGTANYRSPASNPYKGKPGRNEIYARGLRNPFRFSFDGKRILIGDVGQDRFEEVDYETAKTLKGANFGWDRYEGFKRLHYPGDNESKTPPKKRHDKPIFAYGRNHCAGACSVIGGVVVRDEGLETLYGRYLFADAYRGELRSFVPKLKKAQGARYLDQPDVGFPSSFTSDPVTDRVYLTTLGGGVYRLDAAP